METGGEAIVKKSKKAGVNSQTRLIITGLIVSTVFILLAACYATYIIGQNMNQAYKNFAQVLSKTLAIELGQQVRFYDDDSLFGLPRISSIIWALGRLGYQDIITKFCILNEKTKPLFNSQDDTRKILTSIFEEMDKCSFLILKND